MAIERVKCSNCNTNCCIVTRIEEYTKYERCLDPQGPIIEIVGGTLRRYKQCNRRVKMKFSSCVPSEICNLPPKCWGNRWYLCADRKKRRVCNITHGSPSKGKCRIESIVDWPKVTNTPRVSGP